MPWIFLSSEELVQWQPFPTTTYYSSLHFWTPTSFVRVVIFVIHHHSWKFFTGKLCKNSLTVCCNVNYQFFYPYPNSALAAATVYRLYYTSVIVAAELWEL
jgi:hypothetical protein